MKPDQQSIENNDMNGGSPSHKEVKVLLAVVAGILTILIGGSFFLNRSDGDAGQKESIEDALLKTKSQMLREYDPLLVNAVELHHFEEIYQSRGYTHIDVEIALPNLQDVYDYYFEQMIKQEVWTAEDPERHLQEIYRKAVDQAKRTVYPLEKALHLTKDEGRWQVHNPEIFYLVLPHNPTEEIAEDFKRVLSHMTEPMELEIKGEDNPFFDQIFGELLEENFFHQITFGWNRDRAGRNYRLTATVNEVTEMQNLGSFEAFRPHRREISDQESLVEVIEKVVKEKAEVERNIRTFEIREHEQPRSDQWGYRLVSRGGSVAYFRQMMEAAQSFFQEEAFSLDHLANLYLTTYPREEDPWPSPLNRTDYHEQQVMARSVQGNERRKLMVEGGQLLYRIYDSGTLEVKDEIVIEEEIQREKVITEDLEPKHWNEIRRQEDYDLIFYGEGQKYIYRVEEQGEGLRKTELSGDYGNFSQQQIYYLNDRPYHIGHRGLGRDQELKEIQIIDMTTEQIFLEHNDEDLMDENYYISTSLLVNEEENVLLINYRGPEDSVKKMIGDDNLRFYQGTDEGMEVEERLTEALRELGVIKTFEIMDEWRIFIENFQQQQWVLDLREKSVTALNPPVTDPAFLEGLLEEERQREQEENPDFSEHPYEIYGEHQYRFTPMGEDMFFVEGYFHSTWGASVFQREIWEVHRGVSRKLGMTTDPQEGTLQYAYEDEVLILTSENRLMVFEPNWEGLKSASLGEPVNFSDLGEHPGFTLVDSYQKPDELMENPNFYIFGPQLSFRGYHHFRYHRETGNLFYSSDRGSDRYTRVLLRDKEKQPLMPLWDYQELSIDPDFTTLYYRDHESTKVYDVAAFVKSLQQVSAQQNQ